MARLNAICALVDQDPTICPLVRVVEIDDRWIGIVAIPSLANIALVVLAHRFPHLSNINLFNHPNSGKPLAINRQSRACLTGYSSVQALRLDSIVVPSIQGLAHLLVSLPSLRDLLCKNLRNYRSKPESGAWKRHPCLMGRLFLSSLKVSCMARRNFCILTKPTSQLHRVEHALEKAILEMIHDSALRHLALCIDQVRPTMAEYLDGRLSSKDRSTRKHNNDTTHFHPQTI